MYNPVREGAACHLCPRNKDRLKGEVTIVPPTPARGRIRLVLVSEAPTRGEEKMGALLTGRGGGLVKPLLHRIGIRMGGVHVTPAALCRSESDKDADAAARCCAPRLLREVAALPPDTPILTLGKHAMVSVLGVTNLLVARGFVWMTPRIRLATIKTLARQKPSASAVKDSLRGLKVETLRWRRRLRNRTVFPTTSLSYILKADTWAVTLRLDIARLGRWVASGGKLALEDECDYRVWPGGSGSRVG